MKSKNIVLIIGIQLLLISFLLTNIYLKKSSILGEFTINPINKDFVVASGKSSLKHFYEPKADITILSEQPWHSSKGLHTINSDSLNERYDYSIEKDISTYRIITLGDSFTQGVYVDTKANYSEVLEEDLNRKLKCKNIKKFEVINLGIAGYDIEYEVERFKLRGKKYNPDLLVWFLHSSDFYDINEITIPLMMEYRRELVNENGDSLEEVWEKSWSLAKNELYKQYEKKDLKNILLEKLMGINKFYDKKIVIMSMSNLRKEDQEILDRFNKLNNNNHHLFKLEHHSRDFFIPNDAHPNEKGHSTIADELFNNLVKNQVIPCN